MKSSITATMAAAGVSGVSGAYVWPSKYDLIEDMFSNQAGAIQTGFNDAVNPCSFGTNMPGVQNAAEWVRVAYHDMATADVAKGTGGIDASIRYELARSENEGAAFNHTLAFFANFYDVHMPMSELIALGVVTAVEACGGPAIEYRAGRVDATELGPAGVPRPDMDIESTTEAFARQGFTQAEMIALVACGHTLGGVHHEDFPQIIGDDTPGKTTQFENNGSAFIFDNHVVTEFIDNTTPNPLVMSHNDTFNSDKRVFESDGNATVTTLADPNVFRSTCQTMLARMINTVPSSVTLSEPISAFDIKPYIKTIALTANGTISLGGQIRVRMDQDPSRSQSDMQIDLVWTDRNGKTASTVIPTNLLTFQGGFTSGLHGCSFIWFTFATEIDGATGISGFQIRMTKPSTGAVTTFDNGGTGSYPVDDSLLYQSGQSCLTTSADNTHSLTIVAAVRNDRAKDVLSMDVNYRTTDLNESFAPFLSTRSATLSSTSQTVGDYTIFNTTVAMDEAAWFDCKVDLALGADKKPQLLRLDPSLLADSCASL